MRRFGGLSLYPFGTFSSFQERRKSPPSALPHVAPEQKIVVIIVRKPTFPDYGSFDRVAAMRPHNMLVVAILGFSVTAFGCSNPAPAKAPAPQVARAEQAAAPEVFAKGLSRDQIVNTVKARYPAVSGCHSVAYGGTSEDPGSLTLDWTVSEKGKVSAPRVTDRTEHNSDLESCVLAVVMATSFPKAEADTDVSWRFKFR